MKQKLKEITKDFIHYRYDGVSNKFVTDTVCSTKVKEFVSITSFLVDKKIKFIIDEKEDIIILD